MKNDKFGHLAKMDNEEISLSVCKSAAGYYIGTMQLEILPSGHEFMMPFSRESDEYFNTREEAEKALADGTWTQRLTP